MSSYALHVHYATREKLYRRYLELVRQYELKDVKTPEEFAASIEAGKDWFLRTLRTRTVPMTFEGLRAINPLPDGSPLSVHQCALYLRELIDAGLVVEQQQSDGVDLYKPTNGT